MENVAIFGFGRIGRLTLRQALTTGLFVPRVICDVQPGDVLCELFAVDSNYGRWPEPVSWEDGHIVIGEHKLRYVNTAEGLPDWEKLQVDVVVDCTSLATVRAGAEKHLSHGCKRVLVSAPSKSMDECDAVILQGINDEKYDSDAHKIVSMASCTTNALAPVVKVILAHWGIEMGFFSTVHAYTSTQALTDSPRGSVRDSWAAAENIIPSSSGAAKALQFIWDDLNLTGKAYRVPVKTGSIVELNVVLKQKTTVEAVQQAFVDASHSEDLQGIMGVLEREYASSRIVGETHSSLVDLPLIQVLDGKMLSVAVWYDNEMGYATRLAEMAGKMLA